MEQSSPSASISRLIGLTVVVGVGVGVITGLSLKLLLGDEHRTLLAALTASITTAITSTAVSSLMRGESQPSAG